MERSDSRTNLKSLLPGGVGSKSVDTQGSIKPTADSPEIANAIAKPFQSDQPIPKPGETFNPSFPEASTTIVANRRLASIKNEGVVDDLIAFTPPSVRKARAATITTNVPPQFEAFGRPTPSFQPFLSVQPGAVLSVTSSQQLPAYFNPFSASSHVPPPVMSGQPVMMQPVMLMPSNAIAPGMVNPFVDNSFQQVPPLPANPFGASFIPAQQPPQNLQQNQQNPNPFA